MDKIMWEDPQILGDSLGLTAEERKMWNITTIRPCDANIHDLRKKRVRENQRARRRAKGIKSRKQYLAEAKTQLKPWEAEGISRRTYYRRVAQVRDAAQVRVDHFISKGDDIPVPQDNFQAFTNTLSYLVRLHEYRRLTHAAPLAA
jgi:hypothetical protein